MNALVRLQTLLTSETSDSLYNLDRGGAAKRGGHLYTTRIFGAICIGSIPVLCAASAYAQTAVVSARLLDDATGAPIPAAGVSVARPDENANVVAAAVSDAAGNVRIEGLSAGQYLISVVAAGYVPKDVPLFIGERNDLFNLGDIQLAANTTDRVTVTGLTERAVEIEPGVSSFSIADSAVASSGTALDAMKSLPGITVETDGRILLRGSDKVSILVDGETSALTGIGGQRGLDSIPAGMIERIEIINNPSARQTSTGAAGVINIIYKKNTAAGFSGEYGMSLGVGAITKRRDDVPSDLGSYSSTPKYSPRFSLTYNGLDTDYFLQGEVLWQERLPNNEFTTRFYDDGRIIVSQVPENREQVHYILKGGIDHRFSDHDLLNVTAVWDYEDHTDRAQIPFTDALTGDTLRFWFWKERENTGFVSLAAKYTRDLDEAGRELIARIEYIRGREDETYFLNEVSPIRTGTDQTHIIATEHTVPLTLDYVHPLASGRFEAGLKAQKRWIPITYDVVRGVQSIIYPGLGRTSEWGETIYGGYVNYVHETPGFVIEGGIRAEQTEVYYDLPPENIYYPRSDAYDYFRIFPNVRLTWNLPSDFSASLFYNSRVDRPGEQELRVFPKYDDPELLKVGNPYLRPQFTQTVEASVQKRWSASTLSAAVYHRDIKDAYQRIFAIDPTNTTYDVVNRIYHNTGKSTQTGIELIGETSAFDWASLSGSLSVYRIDIDAYDAELLFPIARTVRLDASEDTAWDAKLALGFDLPADMKLQITGVYYSDRNAPQGGQSARSSVDIGFTAPVFDDRTEFKLSATDIFNTFGIEQTVEGVGFDAIYQNFFETQVITATLTRKF